MNKHQRFTALKAMGCLIPKLGTDHTPCIGDVEINHLTSIAQKKRDDLRTIALCWGHHQAQSPNPVGEAYHKGKKLFFAKYGTDAELLAKQNALLGVE